MIFRRNIGNSIQEYLIPTAIIGTLLFVTLSTLAPNLDSYLHKSIGSGKPKGDSNELNVKQFGKNPILKTLIVTMADGTVLELDGYPSDLAASIEVDGANGTTDSLSALLASMAQQLKEKGKITETQYQQLLDLANQGHELGKIERFLEENIQNFGKDPSYLEQVYNFNGQQFKVHELLSAVGFHTDQNANQSLSLYLDQDPSIHKYFQSTGGDRVNQAQKPKIGIPLYQFIKKYQAVEESGLLADPQLKKVVESISSQIVALGDTTQDTIHHIVTQRLEPATFQSQVASQITDNHSVSLCHTGNGQDSGIQCTR